MSPRSILPTILVLCFFLRPAAAICQDEIHLQPAKTVPALQVADDLDVDLMLQEPLVANPLYLTFDERGRLWVVQYRQYPWPAGLKLISRDNVWRNVYDPPFPPPPPHAADSPFRGHDRITIHEDTDGDGVYDRHNVFLDGLNLATAALPGRGGVFVMNPPYLLFYADADHDDVPDSPTPQVLLSGFGIEDTHSIANSLRWGPDGWIYGAQGSTVSAAVVRHGLDGRPLDEPPIHSMGQNIWRYHPEKRIYEIFAEGGGNAFGIEFDSKGRVYSGHNGGDTRGFHYVQGGYYLKNFGKHESALERIHVWLLRSDEEQPRGTIHAHVRDLRIDRVARSLSRPSVGHLADFALRDAQFDFARRQHPANVGYRQDRRARQRQSRRIGSHQWTSKLAPTATCTSPIGIRFKRTITTTTKGKPTRTWAASIGCERRVRPSPAPIDLSTATSRQLIDKYLSHPNRWFRETALRLIGDRQDKGLIAPLRERALDSGNPFALEALWALNQLGGLDAKTAAELLAHRDPWVRAWTIRLLGDQRLIEPDLSQRITQLAATESSVDVRLQIACSAGRISTDAAPRLVADAVGARRRRGGPAYSQHDLVVADGPCKRDGGGRHVVSSQRALEFSTGGGGQAAGKRDENVRDARNSARLPGLRSYFNWPAVPSTFSG